MLAVFVAAINLFLFVAVRGRWGRLVPALGLASLIGTVLGDAVGGRIGVELLRIGDFHVVAASVAAQVAMLATTLLTALGPVRTTDR